MFAVHGVKTVGEGWTTDHDDRDAELAGGVDLFLVVPGFSAFFGEDGPGMQLAKQGQFILFFVPEKEIFFRKSGLPGKGTRVLSVQYPEVTGVFLPVAS